MASSRVPEDQPFDHTAVARHARTSSRSNLLEDSSDGVKDRAYDPTNVEAGYNNSHDYNLHDKPYSAAHEQRYSDMDIIEPFSGRARSLNEKPNSSVARALGFNPRSLSQQIDDKKRGIGRQMKPYAVYLLSTVMLGVFIYELVLNAKNQGSPLSFKPVVNPMLGPSQSALINAGARYPPCMTTVKDLPLDTQFPCLNNTANPPNRLCSLEDVCGFGGFHEQTPNQWFRFITPIFLHAGIIHFLLNMFAQFTICAQIEREMGSAGFFIVYMAAGIFGNVLGGNFSLVGVPSVGASGAIFGTVAVTWVDLIAHWKYLYRPARRLTWMIVELLIAFAIGYIPFVDNFAHIGGFLMGLLTGAALYPIISPNHRHRIIVYVFRAAGLAAAIVLFVVLIRNFYTSDPYSACSWCRYLSCIPASYNNQCKGTGFSLTSSGGGSTTPSIGGSGTDNF
ncbi:hypothetical protein BXZ70DRAFT_789558 [Cristinia sonorae]|uniref:Rhomboid-type serine protease n=1 Tax=Cristinia sonorae TaxID=1940300 RepID=A0A8K0USQ1_9AGAR|nr:hypothetical protein BXZ70DRAFT_789558 [Cristinia sonorae]